MTTSTLDAAPRTRPCGCSAFTALSRRRLLAAAAAGTGVAGLGVFGDAVRQVAYGAPPGGNVLVVLSLRGGSDGLSLVVPRNAGGGRDHDLLTGYRPGIVVPEGSLLGDDPRFGLHPGFAPLLPMWDAGRFGAVHAVAQPVPNRSHFAAMEEIEDADPGSTARSGWINRMVGLDPDAAAYDAVQVGSPLLPTALVGPAPAIGASRLADLQVAELGASSEVRKASLRRMYAHDTSVLGRGVRRTLAVADTFAELAEDAALPEDNPDNPVRLGAYPAGPLQHVLANTGALIRADLGVRVVTVDYGDWDMHSGLGGADPAQGWMWEQTRHLAGSLAAFFADLGPAAERVTLVTISEFGRRVVENGDHGVDHGYANAMLLLGAGVAGGAVRGPWPGLARLTDDDVSLGTDYRQVLWEVLRHRFPDVADRARVFPGAGELTPVGVMA